MKKSILLTLLAVLVALAIPSTSLARRGDKSDGVTTAAFHHRHRHHHHRHHHHHHHHHHR